MQNVNNSAAHFLLLLARTANRSIYDRKPKCWFATVLSKETGDVRGPNVALMTSVNHQR